MWSGEPGGGIHMTIHVKISCKSWTPPGWDTTGEGGLKEWQVVWLKHEWTRRGRKGRKVTFSWIIRQKVASNELEGSSDSDRWCWKPEFYLLPLTAQKNQSKREEEWMWKQSGRLTVSWWHQRSLWTIWEQLWVIHLNESLPLFADWLCHLHA